jgi:hypothetical protein
VLKENNAGFDGGLMTELSAKMLIGLYAEQKKNLMLCNNTCNASWNLQKAERASLAVVTLI